nr:MAG TPA: hypothetical protein [Caudoviricetes sp.]DAO43512.1 MAG TPA: hypothetical protein [Caudoviricetes sp.]
MYGSTAPRRENGPSLCAVRKRQGEEYLIG